MQQSASIEYKPDIIRNGNYFDLQLTILYLQEWTFGPREVIQEFQQEPWGLGPSGMGSNFKNLYTHVLRIFMQKKKVFPQAGVCVKIGNLVGKI